MSGVVHAAAAPIARPIGGLPRAAGGWLGLLVAAAAVAGTSLAGSFPGEPDRLALVLLLAGGALAQARATHMTGNQVFHTGLAFTVAAALILSPAALILVCLGQHVPEWIRLRYPWFIQVFNVANATLSGLTAWAVYHSLLSAAGDEPSVRAGAAAAAGVAFILVNHALLAVMLRLARGHSLAATGLFGLESLLTDVVLAAVGAVVGLLAVVDPWAAPLAVVPLLLVHRGLVVPTLREQARRDPKTDLLNMRGLDEAAAREIARAERFERPLSALVVDIDDLRGINNRHGHLAGDAALKTIAAILRAEQREYDICARFGGDEFVVVCPETSAEQVDSLKERLLERIARDGVVLHDDRAIPVRASIGASTRTTADASVRDLIRRADGAMYAAKPGSSAAVSSA